MLGLCCIKYRYDHDHTGRVIRVYHQAINNQNGITGDVIGVITAVTVGGALLRKLFKRVDDVVDITIDAKKYPESAKHLDEAIKSGKKNEGVIDRKGSSSRRRKNLKGVNTKKGKDRDEAPPAVINTGEKSSVKHINPSDNRGAGSSIRHQIKGLKDGTRVRIKPKNLDKDV